MGHYNQGEILKRLRKKKSVKFSLLNSSLNAKRGVFVSDSDTIELIRIASEIMRVHPEIKTIADIGTGSGVIVISLAKMYSTKLFYGFESSIKAYSLLIKNIYQNKLTNIKVYLNRKKDWINPGVQDNIDLIISNPPYLGNIEFGSDNFFAEYPDYKYQPRQATRSYDKYGLTPYIKILDSSKKCNARHILFQCNTRFIHMLFSLVSSSEYDRKIINYNGLDKFLYLTRRI